MTPPKNKIKSKEKNYERIPLFAKISLILISVYYIPGALK